MDKNTKKCPHCNKIIKSNSYLKKHLKLHLPNRPKLKCLIDSCAKQYNTKEGLRLHVNKIHLGTFQELSCNFCHLKYKSKQSRDCHIIAAHTLEKGYQCGECSSSFSCAKLLRQHRLVHTDEKPHGCKICPKRYKSRTDLTHHTNDVHRRSKNRDFKCLHCNKTFFNKRALTAHSYTHVQRVMFSCYFCKKGFAHRAYLEIHLRTHTHEKPFSCPILSCQYSCSQASSLTGHKKRNHEQTTGMTTAKIKTSCYFCGKIFTSPDHFLTHIRTHTREIPFTCGLCQKGFKSQDVLKHHISTTHTKEKPYNCVECQKCFLTKAQLTEHVGAVHRKERRYFCEICSYGTYHKNHLKGHSLRQHKAKL